MYHTIEELLEQGLCPRCWTKTKEEDGAQVCDVCHTTITEDDKGRSIHGNRGKSLRMLSVSKGKFVPKG